MKTKIILLFILVLITFSPGCLNNAKKKASTENVNPVDTTTVADTGFTGIKKYYSKERLVKDVTFKNGVRDGLMKTYTIDGVLYQTFWYENGKIQDTANMYFTNGKIFRKTPFKDDSAHGVQTQYYGSGKVRARINFVNGSRTPELEEFDGNGKKITGYPDLVVRIKDDYNTNGSYKIYLELTKKNVKATYYKGEYINGLFNSKKYKSINSSETTGYLELRKSAEPGKNYVGVIAEILTPLGNRYLVFKKIDIPYSNLN